MPAFPPVETVESLAIPLIRDNVDTDAIIPSREIKSVAKTGLADGLFAGWRYTAPGGRTPNPDFVLNDPRYAGASILLGGANFGCGSSREHAAWALAEYGIRAIIAPGFNPIFNGNCIRNGIAPVVLPADAIAAIAAHDGPVRVSLADMTVRAGTAHWGFTLPAEARMMLREGLDAIDLTLKHGPAIDAFIARDRQDRPWIYLGIYLEREA